MTHRIEITNTILDTRAGVLLEKIKNHNASLKLKKIYGADVYTIDKDLTREQLQLATSAITNPITQKSYIDTSYAPSSFTYALEIGYLPAVTDNVGQTTRELLADLLKVQFKDAENVYSSRLYFFEGDLSANDIQEIAATLYNPLIQKATIKSSAEFESERGMGTHPPKVSIKNKPQVTVVDLDISDDELEILSTYGIKGPGDTTRGPLALKLPYLHAIQKYFKDLGRSPTDIELETLAQTWSEHCKHTIFADPIDDISEGLFKTYIKGATEKIRKSKGKDDFCVSVFSDNSGIIAFDNEFTITHKMETHNTPSALDPYGGALTGIVGVNRDTLGTGLGAKPIANMYGFFLSEPWNNTILYRDKDKKDKMLTSGQIMDGVIAGVNTGGNQSGIPTPQGFVYFDARYLGKPLVFAGTIGLLPVYSKGRAAHEKKARPGDYIVMIGGRVGKDGIHGATFSSEALSESSPSTSVQIGDAITQKKFSDAIVREARDQGLYNSITDCGAGGLSSAVGEMARESRGCRVDLEKVPLKYSGLDPWEIWISESQERMVVAVPEGKWKELSTLCALHGVEATVIGEFTDTGCCQVSFEKKIVLDLDMDFLHDGLPKIPMQTMQGKKVQKETSIPTSQNPTDDYLKMLARPSIASYSFISTQYDHEVQANSVLKPIVGRGRVNSSTSVIKPRLESSKGVVLSQAYYPQYTEIDAYAMARATVDAAVAQAVAAGADLYHLALLDNFCWCSSDDPERLYQLKAAARGCYDAAVAYGTPYISGKDSMFNDFKGYDARGKFTKISVPPTLVISSIGVIDDVAQVVSCDLKSAGDLIYIIGETCDELGGSEYLRYLSNTRQEVFNSSIPQTDTATNKRIYEAYQKAMRQGLVTAAHAPSLGGLGAALARMAVGGMLGIDISLAALPGSMESDESALYSQSTGRILASIDPRNKDVFEGLFSKLPMAQIGTVGSNEKIIIRGIDGKMAIETSVQKAYESYHSTFKDY